MADLTLYTVGWICAIETELNAAVLFLDDEHDPPEDLPVNDNNSYVLGRIGKHNVAIAALPFGEYGLTSAATVARDMVRTFPNVRIGLMVGIGGGAPTSSNDIRLGDVVVGSPGSGTGGIFHYDYGKTIQDSSFLVTRHLNQPPQFLLTALNNIKGQYTRRGHNLESAIDQVLSTNPIDLPEYQKPSHDSDRLFISTYKHGGKGQDCITSCPDSSQVVVRNERKQSGPKVHFGTIASANQLMKDATIRDRLSDERNVLCFEMEAAGLMNHFPCLVIRGICDYSDTHKNKAWQGYAAMVAAAFAKDLLQKIAPNKVEAERKLKDVMKMVSNKVDAVSSTVKHTYDNLKTAQARERFNTIVKWMRAPDTSSNLNKALDTRQEGSGQNLIQCEAYQAWKSQLNSFLWLHGIPGSGKTILSSSVIKDLQTGPSYRSVIYYYFDFSNNQKQTFDSSLRSFICQLYCKFEDVRSSLNALYDTCMEGYQQPSTDSLEAVFIKMTQPIRELWIVLDALDECSTDERSATVLPWIKRLSSSQHCNTHVLVTSRPERDIEKVITGWELEKYIIRLTDNLIAEDIRAYVKARVRNPQSKLMERWNQRNDVLDEIENVLVKKANGMFLWVSCQLRVLENCLDRRRLYETLNSLPTTLYGTYDRILNDIAKHPHMKDAITVLQMLVFSESRLTLEQAVDAVAVNTERRPYFEMEARMPDPMDLISCFSSLVNVVENYQQLELQLAHFSVKEYLTSGKLSADYQKPLEEIMARSSIAAIHLAYRLDIRRNAEDCGDLSRELPKLTPFESPSTSTLHKIRLSFPLAFERDYDQWVRHARFAQDGYDSQRLQKLICEFFFSDLDREFLHKISASDLSSISVLPNALVEAARFGLACPIPGLIQRNTDNGVRGESLEVASKEGYANIVGQLLKLGVDANTNDGAALLAAVASGHEKTAEILLRAGASTNAKGGTNYTALQVASQHGHEKIVSLLLKHGAQVDVHDDLYESALISASNNGHISVIKLLLESDANINAQSGGYGTALQAASYCGKVGVVQTLLNHRADVNLLGGRCGSALQGASSRGHKTVTRMLLEAGADPNLRGMGLFTNSDSALHLFCHRDCPDTVQLLIDYGADVNALSGDYETALQIATIYRNVKVVEVLLRCDSIDLNARGGKHGTALQVASHTGCHGIVQMLIERGVQFDDDPPSDEHEYILKGTYDSMEEIFNPCRKGTYNPLLRETYNPRLEEIFQSLPQRDIQSLTGKEVQSLLRSLSSSSV
ncbi:hypothetical protein KAF25_010946 [Fusarium avenaceum]|uniref:NACHT domain-containing protein n=1 Tax=Fusarium avenaceum TaxID=40199 RepID=A0A9P7KPX4_9HYPO|nr:hypothetical protein KAF25_010946 [Fusarium avenaceum]